MSTYMMLSSRPGTLHPMSVTTQANAVRSVDGHGFTEEHTGSTGLRLGSANHVDVAGVGRG